jgi:hypothetical protein
VEILSRLTKQKPLINYIKMTITLLFPFSRPVPLFVCLQNINKNLWHFSYLFLGFFLFSSKTVSTFLSFYSHKKSSIMEFLRRNVFQSVAKTFCCALLIQMVNSLENYIRSVISPSSLRLSRNEPLS